MPTLIGASTLLFGAVPVGPVQEYEAAAKRTIANTKSERAKVYWKVLVEVFRVRIINLRRLFLSFLELGQNFYSSTVYITPFLTI